MLVRISARSKGWSTARRWAVKPINANNKAIGIYN